MKLNDMQLKRGQLIKEARDLVDKAEAEKRELSAEEQARYDVIMNDSGKLKDQIERELELQKQERELEASANEPVKPEPEPEGAEKRNGHPVHPRATDDYRAAFNRYLRGGLGALTGEEHRALQADSEEAGGYLIAPQQFVTTLIKAVDDLVFVRQFAFVQQLTTAESLGAPSLDADPADADWTGEITSVTEDTTLDFGKRELRPHPVSKLLKVSNPLIRKSPMGVEAIVNDRLAYKFGITMEKAYLMGSGANQPLGLFTASALGISTSRDMSTGNSTTAIAADNLIRQKYNLKAQYRSRARWIFHRDAVNNIARLKDGNGNYMWHMGLRAGEPDQLLNMPIHESEYAPNTFTTGLYVGILGDLSKYWIVDALDMQVQRLQELYAATNQTGFIGRMESDGMPVLEEAFTRVKLA